MHCKYSTTSPKPNAQVACCMVELEVVFILPHRVTFCRLRDRWSLARRVHVARPRRRRRRTIALTTTAHCLGVAGEFGHLTESVENTRDVEAERTYPAATPARGHQAMVSTQRARRRLGRLARSGVRWTVRRK